MLYFNDKNKNKNVVSLNICHRGEQLIFQAHYINMRGKTVAFETSIKLSNNKCCRLHYWQSIAIIKTGDVWSLSHMFKHNRPIWFDNIYITVLGKLIEFVKIISLMWHVDWDYKVFRRHNIIQTLILAFYNVTKNKNIPLLHTPLPRWSCQMQFKEETNQKDHKKKAIRHIQRLIKLTTQKNNSSCLLK